MSSATQARRVLSWPLVVVLSIAAVGLTSCGTEEVTFAPPATRDMRTTTAPDDRGDGGAVMQGSGSGEPTLDAATEPNTQPDADTAPEAHDGPGTGHQLGPEHPGMAVALDPAGAPGDAAADDAPLGITPSHALDGGAPPPAAPVCNVSETAPYERSCTRLAMTPVLAASSTQGGSIVASVVDGDSCTSWRSAAGPPQWLLLSRCSGQRCTRVPRIDAIGMFVEGDASRAITVEVQGATMESAADGIFYNISTTSFPLGWAHDDFVRLAVNVEPPDVLRILFNSGPAAPFVVREVIFLDCQ